MNDHPHPAHGQDPGPAEPGPRVHRAARALDLTSENTDTDTGTAAAGAAGADLMWAVAVAGCGLAGAATPPAHAATASRSVLLGLVRALDEVPIGALATPNDLEDAAAHRPGTEIVPAIPDPVRALLAELDMLLAGTDAGGLHELATVLGLDRDTATAGAKLAWTPATEDDGAVGAEGSGSEGAAAAGRLAGQSSGQRVAAALDGMVNREPARWQRWERDAVAWGMRLLLARIGGALLAITEWPQPHLSWTDVTDPPGGAADGVADGVAAGGVHGAHPTSQRAIREFPGAPRPLETYLDPALPGAAPAGTPPRATPQPGPLFPGSAHPDGQPWSWRVGWRDDTGQYRVHSRGREPSHPAARAGAERVVAILAAQPGQARLPLSGELLVPRPVGTRSLDARLVDLEALLIATLNEWRAEEHAGAAGRGPTPWAMRPHHDREDPEQLGSVLALLFDHLGLPLPPPGSAADTSDAHEQAMTAFLAANAITLTPLAQRYLAGMADAGPGAQPLEARHHAGMHAVLDDPSGGEWLTLELRAHHTESSLDARELLDIRALESFLAPPAV